MPRHEKMSMKRFICSDDTIKIDSVIEIDENIIILQSRGGTKGTARATNTDYSDGLRILLKRIRHHKNNFVEAIVDSSRVQELPITDRLILSKKELVKPVSELFTLMSKRMQLVGKSPPNERPTGNANKRIRFLFLNMPTNKLEEFSHGNFGYSEIEAETELSSSEKSWAEGKQRLITHLKRERSRGLIKAKKLSFINKHGRLYCERCKLDPTDIYDGPAGQACIEIHHQITAISEMHLEQFTKLDDLQCLCANCHRVVHAELKEKILAE